MLTSTSSVGGMCQDPTQALTQETDTPAATSVGVGGQAANVAAWVAALGGRAG